MTDDFLGDRRAALEEAFFAKQNALLRQKLKDSWEAQAKKEALAAASGINDDAVLERLGALGIRPDTTAALSLVPLVAVAWADGSIDDNERRAILSGAEEAGLGKQDVGHQLLQRWLSERPSPELLASWKDYTAALSATLSPEARAALKQALQ